MNNKNYTVVLETLNKQLIILKERSSIQIKQLKESLRGTNELKIKSVKKIKEDQL